MEHFRALSLYQPPNFVEAIKPCPDGQQDEKPEYLLGVLMTIPHSQTARIVGVIGFDFIFVDTLHV